MIVSVLIPVFNSESYLQQTIESVIAQSIRNIEIVAVDDGSTDSSLSILERLKKLHKNIIVFSQPNSGACGARNKAFELSSGNYIQFLDADDLLSPRKIEVQLKQLDGKDDFISNGRWGRFYTDNPYDEDIKWGPHESLQQNLAPIIWLCQNHMSQTACWLTPRKLIEKAGLWDESLANNQDGEFFTRVIAQSRQVLYAPEAKVYYRSNLKTSITSRLKEGKSLQSFYQTVISFERVLLALENSQWTRRAVANRYQQFVYRAFPKCPELIKEAERKIKEFGGSSWPPYKGGRLYDFIQGSFGWKTAMRLRELITF